MLWNARTYGLFGLTASFQRSMLNPIEAAPDRLLAKRGSGDPLLGRVKATISHHPIPAWVGPYERVLERFHLSNAQLDPLLTQVARDFVLADPWGYLGHTLQQLAMHLTTGEGAVEVVGWSQREYALAGGAAALGVADYDVAANHATAQAFDAGDAPAAVWPLRLGAPRPCCLWRDPLLRPVSLLVAVILAITVVSAGTINGVVVRYRYPVTWAIYLLAAVGAAMLFSTLRAALTTQAGHWRRLWPTPPAWPTIRRGLTARSVQSDGDLGGAERACHQLPTIVALLTTAVVLAALAVGRSAFARRPQVVQPLAALSGTGPPLSALLDAARTSTPQLAPAPRAVALLLAADQAVDVVGPADDRPDGQRDHAVLLALGQEVDGQRVTFVELRDSNGTIWDTTGCTAPYLSFSLRVARYCRRGLYRVLCPRSCFVVTIFCSSPPR